jgi:hypothetical protein
LFDDAMVLTVLGGDEFVCGAYSNIAVMDPYIIRCYYMIQKVLSLPLMSLIQEH